MEFINTVKLLGGLGVFLAGVRLINSELLKVGAKRITAGLSRYSTRPFQTIAVGAVATAALSSSSAFTVLVVSLVNVDALNLLTATYLVMGANIGTTFSGFIAASSGLSISMFFPLLSLLGVILSSSKKKRVNSVGAILICLGLIFSGLNIMSSAANALSKNPFFSSLFMKNSNPLLLILIGCLCAGLIQSSSAVNGILITLVNTNAVPLLSAIYIILGTNIGSCVTTLLSSGGLSVRARQISYVHLVFNAAGTVVFALFMMIFSGAIESLMALFGQNLGFKVAVFNLVQNIATTLLLLPFTKRIVEWLGAQKTALKKKSV